MISLFQYYYTKNPKYSEDLVSEFLDWTPEYLTYRNRLPFEKPVAIELIKFRNIYATQKNGFRDITIDKVYCFYAFFGNPSIAPELLLTHKTDNKKTWYIWINHQKKRTGCAFCHKRCYFRCTKCKKIWITCKKQFIQFSCQFCYSESVNHVALKM